ncbi:lipoyl synthase [Salinibacter altiplanensis]|uniref:lipoyl synthase n=1 Tax=Salinibacter altiplanensis TaxID=1803181 RepID=UPI000C9F67F3|nr:lipoyl synthase [Salinibacter altiplanensis]
MSTTETRDPEFSDDTPTMPGETDLGAVEPDPIGPSGDGDPGFVELPVVENTNQNKRGERPEWLRVSLPQGETYKDVRETVDDHDLHTVCESANCPNMGECWSRGTATFMILGDVCTRSCGFCAVKTGQPQDGLDWDEPRRVADAVGKMDLEHAVITSINRDDREDGGAPIFAEVIERIHNQGATCEVLTPDFRGMREPCETVFEAEPDIFNHNVETVPSLYRRVRPQANYERSLKVLRWAKEADLRTKSGIMVGLGEAKEEVLEIMDDFVEIGLDVMTIGQYMQPTDHHLPVEEWVEPEVFDWYKEVGEEKGIEHVESSPLTRSSYHAEEHV